MYDLIYSEQFEKTFEKLDKSLKIKILKQLDKIADNPEIGKPMQYERRSTRELYVQPFRISYSYYKEELIILFIDIYPKDKQ